MIRTQVYLTEKERLAISSLAEATGKKQAELIREAVDIFIELRSGRHRDEILDQAAGMWRDRNDLPDFTASRQSWDRG